MSKDTEEFGGSQNKQEMLDFYQKLRRKIQNSLKKRKKKSDGERTTYDQLEVVLIAVIAGVMVAVVIGGSGCASTRPYLVDRGRDAADVFTATVGFGLGAKARVGPVQVGLLGSGMGHGLRGGEFVRPYEECLMTIDIQGIYMGVESFQSALLDRRKRFVSMGALGISLLRECRAPYYYTQIEAVVALGVAIRLGLNREPRRTAGLHSWLDDHRHLQRRSRKTEGNRTGCKRPHTA